MSSIYINELRMSLKQISNLTALKYQALGLSTGHKKRIEYELTYDFDRISLFEGDVLFCVTNQNSPRQDEQDKVSGFLAQKIRNYSSKSLEWIKLNTLPERTLERIIMAMISAQAARNGFFTIYGRTLFKPTNQKGKLAHLAVEATLFLDNDLVKIYLTPSWIALKNIKETYRTQRYDLELVGLCEHRVGCTLAREDGSCPYIHVGKLGYYSEELPLDKLSKDRQQSLANYFQDCPQLLDIREVVLVKASKRAQNTFAYPTFSVYAKLSKTDLATEKQIARNYRNATLMYAGERFNNTVNRIKDLFNLRADSQVIHLGIRVNDVELPLENLMNLPHPLNSKVETGYEGTRIQLQKMIADMQNPQPKLYGGGWLFSTYGAYDRNDVNRIFDRIHPYLIVPKSCVLQSRKLLNAFSDGEYKAKSTAKFDTSFIGINQAESRRKYNVEFVNIWNEEEDIFTVENPDIDYWKFAQDIKRDWNKDVNKDVNRIVIVVVPTRDDEDESSIYHRLKKVFIEEGIPSQFITIETLLGIDNQSVAFGPVLQNLWQNIYSKMGGKPWRLASSLGNIHAFIGIGFGLNPQAIGNHIYAGVAHVFDRYGSWVDIASDAEDVTSDERESFSSPDKYAYGTSSFKISKVVTQNIIYDALRLYQQQQTETGEAAKNIVLHKLGKIYDCEVIGFLEGIRQILGTLDDCRLGILQIEQDHQVRIYGEPLPKNHKVDRTVMRGDSLILSGSKIILATTGHTIRRNQKVYIGIGTPNPLVLTSIIPSSELLGKYKCATSQFYNVNDLANHVMALTQLHWGSARDNVRLPITTLYAKKVADLISKTGAKPDTWTKYNRPWFL